MRLDKYIASVTDYSRTEVKRLLKNRDVLCNHVVATNPAQSINADQDIITLYDNILAAPASRYFMLNKPQGTVCANEDSEHPTVIDLLNEPNVQRLQIAGRLDKDTTGLVLLTDDGQWNHKITSPHSGCIKTYQVTLDKPLTIEAKTRLEQGVQLHHEKQLTKPATVTQLSECVISLSIQEGKYHQVKRMMAAVDNHVVALHREQIGAITLDTALALGEYRSLTENEIFSINDFEKITARQQHD